MSSTFSISSAVMGLRMREVEAQPIRRDQRAFLRDVIAEHLAQRLVQQMRRRMVGADLSAARVIDRERERACRPLSVPCFDRHGWANTIARPLLRVGHPSANAVAP